jgi:cytochrome P450
MEEVVRRHVAGWPIGVTVDLLDLMQRLALDVILAVLLGTSTPTNDWRDAVAELADRIAALGTQRRRRGSCGHEDALAVSRRRVRALCAEEITRRRDDEANVGGLLDRLAATLPDVGSDTEALLDQLVAFLIAGHETTATALSWAVCRIVGTESVNQEVLAAGDAIEAPSPSKAFLDATILETLRLHPAFAILPRTVTRPFQVGPYHLMPGDVVAPCSYLSHRHPDAWTDPERFDPTRFVVGRPSPAQFYPFGSGARRCLGMHFALLEMRVVLADTFRHWHVQRMNAAMPRPVRRSLTLAPEGGLPVVLTPRRCTHGSVTPRPAHEPANSSP